MSSSTRNDDVAAHSPRAPERPFEIHSVLDGMHRRETIVALSIDDALNLAPRKKINLMNFDLPRDR